MSNIVEEILGKIAEGSIEVENTNAFQLVYPLSLPYCPCFAQDELYGFNETYDSLVWSR
jgi:hypothetical protein